MVNTLSASFDVAAHWQCMAIERKGANVKRARIVVADDHQLMRNKVVRLLKRDFDVVDAVPNGEALLEAASRLNPDVCVLDISMPRLSGIETAVHLKQYYSPPKIVFLTIHSDSDFIGAAFKVGAEGYVIKTRMAADLVTAVKEVLAGRTFLSPANETSV
jgi:DNA-binding NarL/FixJ family response regulator